MTGRVGRREVLKGAAALAGGGALAACGGGDDGADAPSSAPSSEAGKTVAALADVPVGGALAAEVGGAKVLLVRTSETDVSGFSAVCPHQGCTVAPASESEGAALACPCHGSRFDLSGAVTQGPAARGLTPFPVTVVDGDVVTA